jgi:hypothetical protein
MKLAAVAVVAAVTIWCAPAAVAITDGADQISLRVGPPLMKVSESRWLAPGWTPPGELNQF